MGATLTLGTASTISDERGEFRFRAVQPGSYDLSVTALGYSNSSAASRNTIGYYAHRSAGYQPDPAGLAAGGHTLREHTGLPERTGNGQVGPGSFGLCHAKPPCKDEAGRSFRVQARASQCALRDSDHVLRVRAGADLSRARARRHITDSTAGRHDGAAPDCRTVATPGGACGGHGG
ncbi:MAG: carboxypeptidase-like regulatory domain-containing protein [Longimicrobiales bacterium]